MNKDKKIELQSQIIYELQEENASLAERIEDLERVVNDNQKIVDAAKTYCDEQEAVLNQLKEAKEKYLQAAKEMMVQKNKYKKDMESLFKTIRKNT